MVNILSNFKDTTTANPTVIKKYCLLPYKNDYESREIISDNDSTEETLQDIYKDLYTYYKNHTTVSNYFSELNEELRNRIDSRRKKGSVVSDKIKKVIKKYNKDFVVNHFSYQKYENTGESKRDECIQDFNACFCLSNTIKPGNVVIADHGTAAKGNKILEYYPIGEGVRKSLNSAYDRSETYIEKNGDWIKNKVGKEEIVDLYPENTYIWDRIGIIMCIKLPGKKDGGSMEDNNDPSIGSDNSDYLCICVKGVSNTTNRENYKGSEVVVLIKKYRNGKEVETDENGDNVEVSEEQVSNPLYFVDDKLNKYSENFGMITPEINAIANKQFINSGTDATSLDKIKNPSGYTFNSFSENNQIIFSFCFKYLGDYTFRALEICNFVTLSAINEKKENNFNDEKEIFGQYLLPPLISNSDSKNDYDEEQMLSFFTHDSGNLIVGNRLTKGSFYFNSHSDSVEKKDWEQTTIKVKTTIKLFTPTKELLPKYKALFSIINGPNISKLNPGQITLLRLDRNFIETIQKICTQNRLDPSIPTPEQIITNLNNPDYKFYIPDGGSFFIVKLLELNNPSDIDLTNINPVDLNNIASSLQTKLKHKSGITITPIPGDIQFWLVINTLYKDQLIAVINELEERLVNFDSIEKGLITTNYEIKIEFLNEINGIEAITTINLSALNKLKNFFAPDDEMIKSLDIEILNVFESIKNILYIKGDDQETVPITFAQFDTFYTTIDDPNLTEAQKKKF